MNITDLINELQMAKSLWYTEVIRANEEWTRWWKSITVQQTETEKWELWSVVLEVSWEK